MVRVLMLLLFCLVFFYERSTSAQTPSPHDSQPTNQQLAESSDHGVVFESQPKPKLPNDVEPTTTTTVTLSAIFTSDGHVTNIRLLKTSSNGESRATIKILVKKSMEVAKLIKFVPACKDGHAVSVYVHIEYSFGPQTEEPR